MSLVSEGNINVLKGKLKQQYAEITNDDLKFIEGKENELLGVVQRKLGKTEEEAKKVLVELKSKTIM